MYKRQRLLLGAVGVFVDPLCAVSVLPLQLRQRVVVVALQQLAAAREMCIRDSNSIIAAAFLDEVRALGYYSMLYTYTSFANSYFCLLHTSRCV